MAAEGAEVVEEAGNKTIMPTLRAKFKKEIIAEFLVPKRSSRKVIIFCDGMPGVPNKRAIMEFFVKKGYWVFHPRYRGSWESGGEFLKKSPHQDILDIIDELPKGFTSIWERVRYKVVPKKIFIIGGSFGGAAALLASKDPRITKILAISPVVDWQAPSKDEPLDWFFTRVHEAFGEAYRMKRKNWNKLKSGAFYNPVNHIKEFDKDKIMIIHAKDDTVVGSESVEKFAKKVGCKFILLKKGGHLSSKIILEPRFYKKIKLFFNS